jgi:putative flippase GtrA
MSNVKTPPSHRYSVPAYIGAGGIATASHYLVTVAAVELLHVVPLAASIAGFSVGAAVKYYLNYFMAFRSDARHSAAVVRFVAVLGVLFVLNAALFWLFNEGLHLHYMLAQVLTTIALIPPGYAVNRSWVFSR